VLFNEPKLLKFVDPLLRTISALRFSALQRAEIAEMLLRQRSIAARTGFSALQRAEIAEIGSYVRFDVYANRFQCSSTSRNC